MHGDMIYAVSGCDRWYDYDFATSCLVDSQGGSRRCGNEINP